MREHLPAREHLSDAEWLALALGENDGAPQRHLARCPQCNAELEKLNDSLHTIRKEAHQAAERPESFWLRQRAAAVSRATRSGVVPRLAWAASFAAVVLAALVLAKPAPRATPLESAARMPVAAGSSAPSAPETDAALLMDVQRSVQRDVPEALEPAALLVDEMNQKSQQARNP